MADRHLGWALLLTAAISLLPAPASPQETVQGPGFAAKASTLAATTLGPSTTAARDRGKTGTEAAPGAGVADCEPDMIGFELVTGYVFTAPDDLLDSIPGTLMLTDCLEACQNNDTCHSPPSRWLLSMTSSRTNESVNSQAGLRVMSTIPSSPHYPTSCRSSYPRSMISNPTRRQQLTDAVAKAATVSPAPAVKGHGTSCPTRPDNVSDT
ncbi:unnamed protein product [Bemisia tabaci]|uniref:Apple domain-containing protein n=1 Tax=Bemisia tabaci TaxID=7038 RepID=A0A9P0EWQ0_BEMTA|nr:unnamed protein product [Bemisia tabaci]